MSALQMIAGKLDSLTDEELAALRELVRRKQEERMDAWVEARERAGEDEE